MPAGLARAEFGDAVSGLWPGRIGSDNLRCGAHWLIQAAGNRLCA